MPFQTDGPPTETAQAGPFGLGIPETVIQRAARIAAGLFAEARASVILFHEGKAWRGGDLEGPAPSADMAAELLRTLDTTLWVEDAGQDVCIPWGVFTPAAFPVRLFVIAPIRSADGAAFGLLCVSGPASEPRDEARAARLQDLADFVADAWAQATASRELAEALEHTRRSEDRLSLALTLADVHVWELDYVRRELIKAGAEDTFFSSPKTYQDLYRDIYVTIDPRDRPAVQAAWARHVEEGAAFRPEYRIARDDDREVWVQGATELFTGADGRPLRLVGAIQNITERKTAEAALRARDDAEASSQAKSELLASMSHELRTPLNAVLGFAEVLRLNQAREPLTRRQDEALGHIHDAGRHLLTLIEDMFELARLDAGETVVAVEPLSLDEALAEVAASFAEDAERAGVRLSFDAAAMAGRGAMADRARLRQVLAGLVSNAIKYNRVGGEAFLSAIPCGDRVEIRVCDTGLGIAAAKLPTLFRPFNRAGREGGSILGAGIGLAIGKRLAESMGGALRVESAEGEGSTFTLVLNADTVAQDAAAA